MNSLESDAAPRPLGSEWLSEALTVAGVDQLALVAFDSALPQAETWDTGAGSPYSAVAWSFFRFVRGLGFNAIQFGPQGAITRDNPSPYDGAAFSGNPLSLAFDALALAPADGGMGLFSEEELAAVLSAPPAGSAGRVPHAYAFDVTQRLTQGIHARLRTRGFEVGASFLAENDWWLGPDALYEALCRHYGVGDYLAFSSAVDRSLWRRAYPPETAGAAAELLGLRLPEPERSRLRALRGQFASSLADYAATQFLLHEQHQALLDRGAQLGLSFFGDFQVGYSRRDRWHFESLFLDGYQMGAPPSRTNPEGQPWGYPVLDPAQLRNADGGLGAALRLIDARARKYFAAYQRIRVDHPHGLVCPWVYVADSGDDLAAVQGGARLFSSPQQVDHPGLDQYSIVRSQAVNPTAARYADNWVKRLTPDEICQFSQSIEVLAHHARSHGGVGQLICEVLSTQPYELGAVLKRYGLGRFRVTQKANLHDSDDVYRSENAEPEDWILLGNHDTPTIWQVIKRWASEGQLGDRADYFAARLERPGAGRDTLARQFRRTASDLAHAALADCLASRARNVIVSFTDLFGFEQPYNTPGVVGAENWALRIPRNFDALHRERVASGRALSISRSLRLALARLAPESELLAVDSRDA